MIKLSDHFDLKRMLKFVYPSILMMLFTSIYSIVDGICVSNFAGKEAFTAVNFIFPTIMIMDTLGFMFGSGGSALVSKTLGEKNEEKANRIFSLITYTSIITGLVITILGEIFIVSIASKMGAQGSLLDSCVLYARIFLLGTVPFMLQTQFNSFLVVAERPKVGLYCTIISGVTNMVLDIVMVGFLKLGIAGAATATIISQFIGAIIPFVYFIVNKDINIHLGKTSLDLKALGKTITNGSSELMSNISMSVVGMVYNIELLHYSGEDGVAAYGVLMYIGFIYVAIFIGYSMGMAPIAGYNYGAKNYDEQKNIFKISLKVILTTSVLMCLASYLLSEPFSMIYASYDKDFFEMTVHAFRLYSFSFLFCGISIFGSSYFTALSNGLISALISFLRTLVFQTGTVIILARLFGLEGIWYSMIVAEVISEIITIIFLIAYRNRYHYI